MGLNCIWIRTSAYIQAIVGLVMALKRIAEIVSISSGHYPLQLLHTYIYEGMIKTVKNVEKMHKIIFVLFFFVFLIKKEIQKYL